MHAASSAFPSCAICCLLAAEPTPAQTWLQKDVFAPRSACPAAYDSARQRVVTFGSGRAPTAQTWEWDGGGWQRQHPPTSPAPRFGYGFAFDAARARTVLFGGQGFNRVTLHDTWEWDGINWTQRAVNGPSVAGALTFDHVRQRVVQVSGAQTWEWDGQAWTQLPSAMHPPARTAFALAADPVRGRVVLFGGVDASGQTFFADTWEWDGSGWSQRTPAATPQSRAQHAMAWDGTRQRIVLVGGEARFGAVFGDTWEWDGSNWTQAPASPHPVARSAHALVFAASAARLLLCGGLGARRVPLGDTWVRTGSTWSLLRPSAAPTAGEAPAMAFDVARRQAVVFGGGGLNNPTPETWTWDGFAWTQQQPATRPPARSFASMSYDTVRQRVLMFGGWSFTGGGGLADTWEWDGGAWSARTPAVAPPARHAASMAFDSARGRAVLFGGYGTTSQFAPNDTWEWDGTTWSQRAAALRPSPRAGGAMAFDAGRGRVVLFGGDSGTPFLDDTWEWDGTTWTARPSPSRPSARAFAAMTYSAARAKIVLCGGDNGSGPVADRWEWDGTTWTNVAQPIAPPPRSAHALVADDARGRLLLFGGLSDTYPDTRLETWLLGTHTPALTSTIGTGCSGGAVAPQLIGFGHPWLGAAHFALDVLSAPAITPGVIALGMATASLPIGPCTLYLQDTLIVVGVITNAAGFCSLRLSIPPLPSLTGAVLFAQAFVLDAGAPIGLAFSPGLQIRLGE